MDFQGDRKSYVVLVDPVTHGGVPKGLYLAQQREDSLFYKVSKGP